MGAEDDIRRFINNLNGQRAEAEAEARRLDQKITALEEALGHADAACSQASDLSDAIAQCKPDGTWRGKRRTQFDVSLGSGGGIGRAMKVYKEKIQAFRDTIARELNQARIDRVLQQTLIGKVMRELDNQKKALEKTLAGE